MPLDRKIKPKPTGNILFNLPDINTFTLQNLLKVYFVEKTSLPIIQIKLIIPSGSIHSPINQYGISTLTSMLIDEGAGKFDSLQISDKIELLGSILNITSNKEYTAFSLLSLKENFEESLKLLSLILQDPNFKDSDFDRETNRLLSQIIQLNDDPSFLASSRLNNIIYKNTPYEYPSNGSEDSISLINNIDIKKFYKSTYTPNGASLIVVGNIKESELLQLLDRTLSNWENENKVSSVNFKLSNTERTLVLMNKDNAAQSEIRVGHFSNKRNSEDFYSRTILNSILGGQFSSRINLNLREDKGFTYGANSNYIYNKLGSTFSISTSVKSENTCESIKEILYELQNIKNNILEEEITFSKSYLVRRYPSLFETFSQIATNLSLLPLYNLSEDYFNNYIDNINSVTSDEVYRSSKNSINLANLVTVIVGNKKQIYNEVSRFADQNEFNLLISD